MNDFLKLLSPVAVLRFVSFFKSGDDSKSELDKSPPNDEKTLIGSQVFFRHGARTPLHVVPSDGIHLQKALWKPEMVSDVSSTLVPFRIVDLQGNCVSEKAAAAMLALNSRLKLPGGAPSGQLTRVGQSEMFTFGQRLRERYVDNLHLIPDTDESHVYFRSTVVTRNIVSSRCVLAGLCGEKYLKSLKEPFCIHTCYEIKEETLVMNSYGCKLLSQMKHVAKFHQNSPLVGDTLKTVRLILGLECPSNEASSKAPGSERYCPLYHIRDDLAARRRHGFHLPDALIPYFEAIDRDSAIELGLEYMGDRSTWEKVGLRAAVGQVCHMILENIRSQIQRSENVRPLILFATHDSLLIPLLMSLDLFDGLWPKFAASMYFEVYEDRRGDYFVQVYYNDRLLKEFTLSNFTKQLERYALTEKKYYALCQTHTTAYDSVSRSD